MGYYKVMLVDDEKWVLEDLKSIINWEVEGFTVSVAVTDSEAVANLCRHIKPDIIISDISMPGMTGLQLLRDIKRTNPDIIFIMISAYSEFSYAQEAIKYGASDYLLKPIKAKELKEALHRAKEQLENENRQPEMEYLYSKSAGEEAVVRTIKYIHDNYEKKLEIQRIADDFNINQNYLGSIFKKKTGKTFTGYLIEYRMARALELLTYTNLTAYEVSIKVGYSEYGHFSKAFKKHFGKTVNEMKKDLTNK